MQTQPQLFEISLNQKDVFYTPDAVAQDMVLFFNPTGKILEPSMGDGAFMRYLPPGSDWCEIERGKDFFKYTNHVDWIIGNPPYSIFVEFLRHSFSIGDNVVYLVPTNKIFQSFKVMEQIEMFGGIRKMLVYGRGGSIGMPFGFSVGAFHFQRNYKGDTSIVFRRVKTP